MKMFEVCAKCGHVGKGNYVDKVFAVKAETATEAASKTRWFPRVKHHHDDAIRYVLEVDEVRFNEIVLMDNNDPYFFCTCVQDQRRYDEPGIRKEHDFYSYDDEDCEDNSKKVYYFGKKKLRNPKKYMNKYNCEERVYSC